MIANDMPAVRPANPRFSSGPTTKRPGWTLDALSGALLGRSHRSVPGKARIREALELTRKVLQVPDTHRIAIVPGSDTGAVEMAMWNMLGARGVDVMAWESFGSGWVSDAIGQLRLTDLRVFEAPFGELPDLEAVDTRNRDIVFTWNGTTSGVRVPDGDWIAEDRDGITICDATSAAFAQRLDWDKLDAVTYSWQKVMGGEAAHGILVLSPRAVERLENFVPDRPIPKIFQLTKNGKLNEALFAGETINTVSMLCVEDYLDTLRWAESIGGLDALIARADGNCRIVEDWVARTPWVGFLAREPYPRSNTGVCLIFTHPAVAGLDAAGQTAFADAIVSALEEEGIAYDFASYRDAPAGLRIWTGATIEASDLTALLPWIEWAFEAQLARLKAAA